MYIRQRYGFIYNYSYDPFVVRDRDHRTVPARTNPVFASGRVQETRKAAPYCYAIFRHHHYYLKFLSTKTFHFEIFTLNIIFLLK